MDVSRLPLDLQRIYRQLQQSTIREERDGLNLRRASRDYRRQVRTDRHTKSQYRDRSDVRLILETIEHLYQVTGIDLIEAVIGDVARVTADAAYDTIAFYESAGSFPNGNPYVLPLNIPTTRPKWMVGKSCQGRD